MTFHGIHTVIFSTIIELEHINLNKRKIVILYHKLIFNQAKDKRYVKAV